MNWELLLLLACPLMMVFCMKGMFSGSKNKEVKKEAQQLRQGDLQTVQQQVAELMEQNNKLIEEVHSLKQSGTAGSKVVQLDKERMRMDA